MLTPPHVPQSFTKVSVADLCFYTVHFSATVYGVLDFPSLYGLASYSRRRPSASRRSQPRPRGSWMSLPPRSPATRSRPTVSAGGYWRSSGARPWRWAASPARTFRAPPRWPSFTGLSGHPGESRRVAPRARSGPAGGPASGLVLHTLQAVHWPRRPSTCCGTAWSASVNSCFPPTARSARSPR